MTGLFSGSLAKFWERYWPQRSDMSIVGSIKYDNGVESQLQVPNQSSVEYNLEINKQETVAGIHIDSHAPITHFQQVGNIPTTIINPAKAYNSYNSEFVNRYQGGHTGSSPAYRMKEAIIAMTMFGEGNSRVQGNEEVLNAYLGFIKALRIMLPASLGFENIAVRPPDVVLVTKTGEFILDAASGGVMTIIDLTWRLQMFSHMNDGFVVTIDEPENHLHPSMQRTLMGRLVRTFPQAQFVIATHSPFMVSSVKDSNVYVLRYINTEADEVANGDEIQPSQSSRVISEKLDTINKAGNASEILREVLGVRVTMPQWAEEALANIVSRYRGQEITSESLSELKNELSELGYDVLYPDVLAALTQDQ